MKSHPCLTSLLLLLPLVQPSCGSCVLWNLSRLNYRCKHNVSVICLVYFGTTYDKNLFLYTGQFIQLCTSFLSPSSDVRVRQTNPSSLCPWPSFPNVEINFWEGLTWQVLQQNNVTSIVKQCHDRASSIFWGAFLSFCHRSHVQDFLQDFNLVLAIFLVANAFVHYSSVIWTPKSCYKVISPRHIDVSVRSMVMEWKSNFATSLTIQINDQT